MTPPELPAETTLGSKIKWGRVVVFYAIAFALSGLFNSGLLTTLYQKITGGLLIVNWPFLPAGIGTLIAALLAFRFDRNLRSTISLLGNSPLKNIVISGVPLLVFTGVGVYNKNGVNPHSYGLAFAFTALLYAIAEEVFWRSYLLDTLRPLNKMVSSLIIGTLWWAWHFRFATPFDVTWFLLICIVSSFLLGQFANETKSFLTAAGLHSLLLISTSEGGMTNANVAGMLACIGIWVVIGKVWKTKQLSLTN